MVAMGRALMLDPKLLLLDEPSAGLSPLLQDEVFLRCKLINEAGVAILMVEQNARRAPAGVRSWVRARPGDQRLHGLGTRTPRRPQGHRALPRHLGSDLEAGPVRPLAAFRTPSLPKGNVGRPRLASERTASGQQFQRMAAARPAVHNIGPDAKGPGAGPGLLQISGVQDSVVAGISCRRRSQRRGRCRCCRHCRRPPCPSDRCPFRPSCARILEDSLKPMTMIASGSAAAMSSISLSNDVGRRVVDCW